MFTSSLPRAKGVSVIKELLASTDSYCIQRKADVCVRVGGGEVEGWLGWGLGEVYKSTVSGSSTGRRRRADL